MRVRLDVDPAGMATPAAAGHLVAQHVTTQTRSLVETSYAATHVASVRADLMSRWWAGGSTRAYRVARAFVLDRDGRICRAHQDGWCAKAKRKTSHTCTSVGNQAHHTRGKRHGDDPNFMVASCAACNLYIGDPEQSVDPQPKPVTIW